jgi:hypothetical protein
LVRLEGLPTEVAITLFGGHEAILHPGIQARNALLIFVAHTIQFRAEKMLIGMDRFITVFIPYGKHNGTVWETKLRHQGTPVIAYESRLDQRLCNTAPSPA